MKTRHFCALLLAAAVSCSLLGCNKNADNVVIEQDATTELSFSWWGNDDRNEYTLEAIRQFEDTYPNIHVTCQYSDWSGYQLRNDIHMASRTETDVMQINYAWITQYFEEADGYFPLDAYASQLQLQNFDDTALAYGKKDGTLYAVPIALNSLILYHNQTIYDQYSLTPPKTFADLLAVAPALNAAGITPIGMPQKQVWLTAVAYAEETTGKTCIDETGKFGFGAAELEMMLQLYKDLVDGGALMPIQDFDRAKLSDGSLASSIGWLSDASNYCDTAIKNGYNMVATPALTIDNPKIYGWYMKPATMYAVSSHTEHPEESALLMNYLLNSAEVAKLQGLEKGIPLSSSAQDTLRQQNLLDGIAYSAYEAMQEKSESMQLISPYLENSDIIEAYKSACDEVLYDKATAADAATALLATMQELLSALNAK